MIKIGLIVNPIAGLGGSVGLKGTDGMEEEALRRGAEPLSNMRAKVALSELLPLKEQTVIYTGSKQLGEDTVRALGFAVEIVHESQGHCTAADTEALAKALENLGVQLILFAGGDGTAKDIYRAIENRVPSLGIPSGVKIYSPVYAKNPKAAGELARLFVEGKIKSLFEQEVLDIDEELYRKGHVDVRLYGYLNIPQEKRLIQNRKMASSKSEESTIDEIAGGVIRSMEADTYYLIGAGTTTRRIMEVLNLPNTLIGVDIIKNQQLIASDVYGKQILDIVQNKPVKLVVTVTGGQGFLFGRGNQQITPSVLRLVGKENIMILATQKKLASLGGWPLLLDTGDEALDAMLRGYYRVMISSNQMVVAKAE
ncbi:MAG: ATP-NAD kinase [Clostridia bacterium]|nr:ATP-NAD kinase [Clostridia bacterium]